MNRHTVSSTAERRARALRILHLEIRKPPTSSLFFQATFCCPLSGQLIAGLSMDEASSDCLAVFSLAILQAYVKRSRRLIEANKLHSLDDFIIKKAFVFMQKL